MGWLVFHNSQADGKADTNTPETAKEIWTCSMHPQIRVDHKALCPLCAMDLIPVQQGSSQVDPDAIVMTEEAAKLADVQTSIVSMSKPEKEIRLYGKIQADERLVQTQPSHLPGRIEQLFVNFTGEFVSKGQVIAQIYSPSLITAQQELIEAKKLNDPRIPDAIREKLKQWKLTDVQIADIEKSGQPKSVFDITATVSGVVINKKVNRGDYVAQGTPLYEISDLSNVWVLFDAYQSDLPWIKKNDVIKFTVQSLPEKEYTGQVAFIDPVINPQTRIARIRVEIANSGNILKPEMFVSGVIKTQLETTGKSLVIPQSSVLWTGTRSVVYVKIQDVEEPTFIMREITLGQALGNSYVVLDGLKEGEVIVTNGTFSVDAAAQLSGKSSMMNGKAEQKNSKSDSVLNIPDYSENTDIKFKKQLTSMYNEYLKLKDALVASDEKKSGDQSKLVNTTLSKIDLKLLKGEPHKIWNDYAEKMKKYLKDITTSKDIKIQREIFSEFNYIFYQSIKSFGLDKTETYYQYCPMALDDRGAYWFSSSKEISNPYFGKSMLKCGETKEIIN